MNPKGHSLVELMVSVAIAGIISIAVTYLAIAVNRQYVAMRTQMEAETEADRLEFLFRTYFGQAMDIAGTDLPADTTSYNLYGAPPNVIGQIHSNFQYGCIGCAAWPDAAWQASPYLPSQITSKNDCGMSYTTVTPLPCTVPVPQWTTLAVFLREGGTGLPDAVPAASGTPMRTAIYFRRPEPAVGVNPPSTGGVVFFDNGTGPAGTVGAPSLTASYTKEFVARVTYLGFQKETKVNIQGQSRATSLQIQYRIRYHNGTADTRSYCPKNDIVRGTAGCGSEHGYVDLERKFVIFLKNNLFKPRGIPGLTGHMFEERTAGALLFFKPVIPLLRGF